MTDGRLDWTPTSETAFLQRVLSLAAELGAADTLPALKSLASVNFSNALPLGERLISPSGI